MNDSEKIKKELRVAALMLGGSPISLGGAESMRISITMTFAANLIESLEQQVKELSGQ